MSEENWGVENRDNDQPQLSQISYQSEQENIDQIDRQNVKCLVSLPEHLTPERTNRDNEALHNKQQMHQLQGEDEINLYVNPSDDDLENDIHVNINTSKFNKSRLTQYNANHGQTWESEHEVLNSIHTQHE